MRPPLRRSTISNLFLALLCLCAAFPIILLSFYWQFSLSLEGPFLGSDRLAGFIAEQKEFIGRTSGIVYNISHWTSFDHLNSIGQEVSNEIKEPNGIVYRDEGRSVDNDDRNSSSENFQGSSFANVDSTIPSRSGGRTRVHEQNAKYYSGGPATKLVIDDKIRYMEDQVITARAFLHYPQQSGNSRLVRELKLRIKEIEKVLSQATKDSDLHRSALQKINAMENTLYKAKKAYPDCSATATKLRAMTYNTEEQLRAQIKQVTYLTRLASRAYPKGLHCLSMRLTTEFFALSPEKRQLPHNHKFQIPELYHYAIFSDNILACAVVVNSTIANSKEQEKIVFHVVTDSLNFFAMVMWFLMNPLGKAAIQIQSMAEFEWLPLKYDSMFRQLHVSDTRYASPLNHLRFYLPDIFPSLNKVLFLDHDVVVQKDLRRLWSLDMGGKVVAVVEACKNDILPQRLEVLVNFSDLTISQNFDPITSVWSFGMNMFDLRAWRREGLVKVFEKWLQVGMGKQLWKAGSLPLGQLVFYNQTFVLDPHWHLLGLGQGSTFPHQDIKRAAVIHYSGLMKPWLEIAIPKYKAYWIKYLDFKHPHLQHCNIHP